MRKKIQSLFMVTILLVSLAVTGCGSNKENAKESNTNVNCTPCQGHFELV